MPAGRKKNKKYLLNLHDFNVQNAETDFLPKIFFYFHLDLKADEWNTLQRVDVPITKLIQKLERLIKKINVALQNVRHQPNALLKGESKY